MGKVFYIAEVLDNLQTLFGILGFLGCLLFVLVYLITQTGSDNDEDARKSAKRWSFRLLAIGVIATMVSIALPSKKTYVFMKIGGIVDTAVEDNPNLKKLPENAIILLNKYIEDELEEEENKNK